MKTQNGSFARGCDAFVWQAWFHVNPILAQQSNYNIATSKKKLQVQKQDVKFCPSSLVPRKGTANLFRDSAYFLFCYSHARVYKRKTELIL